MKMIKVLTILLTAGLFALNAAAQSTVSVLATNSGTIDQSGPRGNPWYHNAQGPGDFAMYSISSFLVTPDLFDVPVPESVISELTISYTQANASFTTDGNVGFFITFDTALGASDYAGLMHSGVDVGIDDAQFVDTPSTQLLGMGTFTQVESGHVDTYVLDLSSQHDALKAAIVEQRPFSIIIAAPDAGTAATYAGIQSTSYPEGLSISITMAASAGTPVEYSEPAIQNGTIDAAGPRGNPWYHNAQGPGDFAQYGISSFHLTPGDLGGTVLSIDELTVSYTQALASFSADGPVELFISFDGGVEADGYAALFHGGAGNGIVDDNFSDAPSTQSLGEFTFTQVESGTVDTYVLDISAVHDQLVAAINAPHPFNLILTADDRGAIATYAGNQNNSYPDSIIIGIKATVAGGGGGEPPLDYIFQADFESDTPGERPAGWIGSPSTNTETNGQVVVDASTDPANPMSGQSLYVFDLSGDLSDGENSNAIYDFAMDPLVSAARVKFTFMPMFTAEPDDGDTRMSFSVGNPAYSLTNSDFRLFEFRIQNNGKLRMEYSRDGLGGDRGSEEVGEYDVNAPNTLVAFINSHSTATVTYDDGTLAGTLAPNMIDIYINGTLLGSWLTLKTPDPVNAPEIDFWATDADIGRIIFYQDSKRQGGMVYDDITIAELEIPPQPDPDNLLANPYFTMGEDGKDGWMTYLNVFDAATGGYKYGTGWDTGTAVVSDYSVELHGHPGWSDNGNGPIDLGDIIENNFFTEFNLAAPFVGEWVEFSGNISVGVGMDAGSTGVAFIKILDGNWQTVFHETVDAVEADGTFAIKAQMPTENLNAFQVGFARTGVAGTSGSIIVSDLRLEVTDPPATPAMVISGVMDGTLPGGLPKAVELYVLEDIPDLSIYALGAANNGGGTDGPETPLEGSAVAGQYLWVASDETEFMNVWGFAPDFVGDAANVNGDDAIELFLEGKVIDVFGEIDVDGTGQPWEYTDGWAYKTTESGPNHGTFVIEEWTFSGVDALDDLDAAAIADAVPFGYYPNPIPQPDPLPWDGAVSGDFVISPWFGAFEVSDNGWINHNEQIWLYVGYVTKVDNMWMYSLWLDSWAWSSMSAWPWIYNAASGSWVYYFNVPDVGVWQYDVSVGSWTFYPAG